MTKQEMLCYLYKDKDAKKEEDHLWGFWLAHSSTLLDAIKLLLERAKKNGVEYSEDYYVGVIENPTDNDNEVRKTIKAWLEEELRKINETI